MYRGALRFFFVFFFFLKFCNHFIIHPKIACKYCGFGVKQFVSTSLNEFDFKLFLSNNTHVHVMVIMFILGDW